MADQEAIGRPAPRVMPDFRLPETAPAYLLLLPSLVIFAVFVVLPVLNMFVAAFSETDTLGRVVQVGTTANFQVLAQDQFLPQIVRQTVIFTLASVAFTSVLAFALALILNNEFRGRDLAKGLILIPWAMPFAIAAMTWRWIFNGEVGALNYLLGLLGLTDQPIAWLSDPGLAFLAATFVNVWASVPFMAITFLAGLQALPPHVYDAAKMDGAGPLEEFRDMTLPLMRNVIMVVTLLTIIWVFRSFSILWILTRGEPIHRTDIVVTYLYKLAFDNNAFGTGFALAVVMFIALAIFSFAYIRLLGGRDVRS